MKTRRIFNCILKILPLVILLIIWQYIGSSSSRMFFLYATPASVASMLWTELSNTEFLWDVGVTSSEVIVGLLIGNSLGTLAALLLWFYPKIGNVCRPYMIALGSIPIFAIMPLFILWFGIGFEGKISIIVFSTAFVTLSYSFAAAVAAGREYHELISSIGGTRYDLLKKAVIPATIAHSFIAYRINVSFALIGAYVAEWVGAKNGLGQYIMRASSLYDVPRVWAGLIVFLTLAFVLYSTTSLIELKIVPSPDKPTD